MAPPASDPGDGGPVVPDPGDWLLAPAKVNLTLHVTGLRPDGRHALDSVVAFADVGDRLTVGPGDGLRVTGPFAAGVPTDGTNLIARALAAVGARRAVTLDKRLPYAAGLGGGTSDAAAVLRAVGARLDGAAMMARGADLPVCLLGRAARMRGAGEAVAPLALPSLPAVLANPGVPVPTGAVFAALERRDGAPMPDPPAFADATGVIRWLGACRNDLEPPAIRLAPAIADCLAALRGAGAGLARMSGSGGTSVGLFASAAAARAAAAALARPGWWVAACRLS